MTIVKIWLVMANAAVALAWCNVLRVILSERQNLLDNDQLCELQLMPATKVALYVSFVELFNSIVGFTRSRASQVLLFGVVRLGVEILLTPVLSGSNRLHLFTVLCWSLGDTVRFTCFFFDNLVASSWPKAIRYSVGPFLFPLGAFGEMLMVLAVGLHFDGVQQWLIFGAAGLWPLGFINLYQQLLKQRRKFFAAQGETKNKQT